MLRFGVTEEQVLEALGEHYKGEVRLGVDLMAVDIGDSVYVYSAALKVNFAHDRLAHYS